VALLSPQAPRLLLLDLVRFQCFPSCAVSISHAEVSTHREDSTEYGLPPHSTGINEHSRYS